MEASWLLPLDICEWVWLAESVRRLPWGRAFGWWFVGELAAEAVEVEVEVEVVVGGLGGEGLATMFDGANGEDFGGVWFIFAWWESERRW
jgi:hypothetical protein